MGAPGGTAKTFFINLLLANLRQNERIAFAVASSGIVATLLHDKRTAYSALKLPLDLTKTETPAYSISWGSAKGNLLVARCLIIWDEATMNHKNASEALDRSLQDFRRNTWLMGDLTVLLADDFRQTL